MKKLLALALLLVALTGCGNENNPKDIYPYNPSIPEYAYVIYGQITDKDEWTEERYSTYYHSDVIDHYYAFIVLEDTTEVSYFIQVEKATYEANEVGDHIGIVWGGIEK